MSRVDEQSLEGGGGLSELCLELMSRVQKEGEDYLKDVQIALEQKHNELESVLRYKARFIIPHNFQV